MVDNLVSALRDRINGLDWMSQPTKVQAVAKLNAFLRKVAYPDKWRDYSTLAIKPGCDNSSCTVDCSGGTKPCTVTCENGGKLVRCNGNCVTQGC